MQSVECIDDKGGAHMQHDSDLESWGILDSELVYIPQPGGEVWEVAYALLAALEQRRVAAIVPDDGWVHPEVGLCEPAWKQRPLFRHCRALKRRLFCMLSQSTPMEEALEGA